MAGNLLDNACKWSKGQVGVTHDGRAQRRRGAMLLIRIEDDGPGLTEEEAQKVLRRGVRLDEKTPGSGLGLDIVKELVDVYGGSLQLKRSVLGGLLAELRLAGGASWSAGLPVTALSPHWAAQPDAIASGTTMQPIFRVSLRSSPCSLWPAAAAPRRRRSAAPGRRSSPPPVMQPAAPTSNAGAGDRRRRAR